MAYLTSRFRSSSAWDCWCGDGAQGHRLQVATEVRQNSCACLQGKFVRARPALTTEACSQTLNRLLRSALDKDAVLTYLLPLLGTSPHHLPASTCSHVMIIISSAGLGICRRNEVVPCPRCPVLSWLQTAREEVKQARGGHHSGMSEFAFSPQSI